MGTQRHQQRQHEADLKQEHDGPLPEYTGYRNLQHDQNAHKPDIERGAPAEQLTQQEQRDKEEQHAVNYKVLPKRSLEVGTVHAEEERLVVVEVWGKGDASDKKEPDSRRADAYPRRNLQAEKAAALDQHHRAAEEQGVGRVVPRVGGAQKAQHKTGKKQERQRGKPQERTQPHEHGGSGCLSFVSVVIAVAQDKR